MKPSDMVSRAKRVWKHKTDSLINDDDHRYNSSLAKVTCKIVSVS